MKPGGYKTSTVDSKTDMAINGSGVDYNRLYGDLCRKLLSTPVGEIFPGVVSEATPNHVTSASGSTSPTNVHPAFPTFGTMAPTQLSYLTNFYNPNGLLTVPMAPPKCSSKQKESDSDHTGHTSRHASPQGGVDDLIEDQLPVSGTGTCIEDMSNVDIQKLVDEFRMTLERYGVSQRFAARFIMQDTSQGNLSFLMEKGRNKKWEELSPRGRIPYLKMKTWLESKDEQMLTLEMLKHSQETRKNTHREAYNRRERFTMFQLNVLCRLFEDNSNPPMNIRNAVAERLGIPLDRVNVWFQNQRARGFPARKILQQTAYDNGPDSFLAIDVENMKDKINEVNFPPNGFRASADIALYKREMDHNGSVHPLPQFDLSTYLPVSSGAKSLEVLAKTEAGDTSLSPLDLSSASNIDVRKNPELSSPVTNLSMTGEISHAPNVKDEHFDNAKSGLHSYNACHTNSAAKYVTSGAAKRKRGSRHIHINSANKIETCVTSSIFGTESEIKRRKVEELQAPRSNYTYFLETTDTPQTSNKTRNTSNEYDYIIKCETNVDTDTSILSGTNDKDVKNIVEQEQVVSSDETENKLDLNTSNSPGKDEVNQLTKESKEELPTKSVALFKAMCASLARKEGNSKDINMKEPDLD